MGHVFESNSGLRARAAADSRLDACGRSARRGARVDRHARWRDASDVAGDHRTSCRTSDRRSESLAVLARRLPAVREPAPGALLVAGRDRLGRLCDFRVESSGPRLDTALLLVAANHGGLAAERGIHRRIDRPDSKRLSSAASHIIHLYVRYRLWPGVL